MWIIPSVCNRARLQPLVESALASNMRENVVCLFDIRGPAPYPDVPPNWTLVPAVASLSAAETVRIARLSAPKAESFGILPVDHRPLTPGWDAALTRAAGSWNVAFCNDIVSQGDHALGGADHLTGAFCLGGSLVQEVGDIIPSGMTLFDARVAWMALGQRLGLLRFLRSVVVEKTGEAPDELPLPPGIYDSDRRARLFRWLNDELRPLAARLREAMAREQQARVYAHADCAV